MSTLANPTKFNEIQLQLLQMFNRNMSKEETIELKKHIAKFFADKLNKKLDEMYESGEMTDKKWEDMFKKHPKRRPYPKSK
jgi:hypothetical protein